VRQQFRLMLRNKVTKANHPDSRSALRVPALAGRKQPGKSGAPKLSRWECGIGSVWK